MTRKQLAQLLILVLVGWGVGHILKRTAPLGRDIGGNSTARAVLQDRSYPSREVADPTLTLVVFTDYQCPACRLANSAMEAAIVHDGHVRVVYRDRPIFGPVSERLARVAIAADIQGVYPKLHSLLMREGRVINVAVLRELVGRSGANWVEVRSDLRAHGDAIDARLAETARVAFALGIPGTPAYLAGSVLLSGATNEAGFRSVFAQARKAERR